MAPRTPSLLTNTLAYPHPHPPLEDPAFFLSSSLPAPSPFLKTESLGNMLPLPESPLPARAFPVVPSHRHHLSTSSAPPAVQDKGKGKEIQETQETQETRQTP